MENVGILGHFVYFVAIWYILCYFYVFSHFGVLNQEKSGNHAPGLSGSEATRSGS
jgi:hypothetical protein